MRPLSKLFAIGVVSLSLVTGACGGSSDSPSGPLSKHFDDMNIARVPIDQQRAAIENVQSQYQVAKMENANAEAEEMEAKSQLAVVKNDQKASKLAIDSALSNKKSAESSNDNNRINQAARELHAAEAAQKAASERVKYYEAYASYAKKQHRYTLENMYWREAQFELAKAQLAQKNNVSPKGVDYNWFPSQEQDRGKKAASAKGKAEDERKKALSRREGWLKMQADADKENNRNSALPDPMAPKATAGGAAGATSAPAPAPAPSE
jgi:vacuolar-type H+-ATPase subunit I/STV1